MVYFPVPQAVIFHVRGAHASRYLQARLTNDIRAASQDKAVYAAALTPQGKTEALFTVFAPEKDEYILYADGGDPAEVLQALKRFLVAERVEIVDQSHDFLLFHVAHLDPPIAEFKVQRKNHDWLIARKRIGPLGWDTVVNRSRKDSFIEDMTSRGAKEMSEWEVSLARLKAGVPAFPTEINGDHLFSSSGLVNAVSFTKGCYTGQEVIAKIDSLGKPPRVLKLLDVHLDNAAPGNDIMAKDQDKPIGKILSVAYDPAEQVSICFADLRNVENLEQIELRVNGARAKLRSSVAPAPR